MMRATLAVLLGFAVWTALWLAGNSVLFTEAAEVVGAGERYTAVGPLSGAIGLSVVCSLSAGLVASKLGGAGRPVAVLAGLLLLTGLGVQVGAWDLMPVWYHVLFLVLLVPCTCLGGCLGARGTSREPRSAP